MQYSARKAAARVAVASALAGVSLAFTPLSAQADSIQPVQPPAAITVSNVRISMPDRGSADVVFDFTLSEDSPQSAALVDISVEIVGADCSGSTYASVEQTFTEGYSGVQTSHNVFILDPGAGYVIATVSASDGLGGFTPAGTYLTYVPISIGEAGPSSSVTPDASGTGGAFDVHTDSLMPSYVLGTWINDVFQGEFTLDACSDVSVPFSGLAPGDYIELRSPDLLGQVVASYTAPGATAKSPPLSTEATDTTTELAHTGEVIWPLAPLAIALLGTGSYLTFRRARQVGPPTS